MTHSRLQKKQGFPVKLDIKKHLKEPYKLSDVKNKVFPFRDKPKIRFYQIPPVRVFLVENIKGKWIYWGLAHILEIKHDYTKNVTSGKYKIIYLNSPEEMKKMYEITDRRRGISYFK